MNQPNSVDIFGKGIRDIIGKIEGLKDYKFSIAIENGIHDNYFTEKILDCFLTGTIPIYRGPKNIGDFFDINGIITFETVDELINIVNTLTDNEYQNRIKSIENNFGLAKKFSYNNNQIFNNFLKDLI